MFDTTGDFFVPVIKYLFVTFPAYENADLNVLRETCSFKFLFAICPKCGSQNASPQFVHLQFSDGNVCANAVMLFGDCFRCACSKPAEVTGK